MKISDLQDKTIININNGKELGKISDLEIDDKGVILYYHALYKKSIFNIFNSNEEFIFRTSDIKKIGEDVILVQID